MLCLLWGVGRTLLQALSARGHLMWLWPGCANAVCTRVPTPARPHARPHATRPPARTHAQEPGDPDPEQKPGEPAEPEPEPERPEGDPEKPGTDVPSIPE